MKRFLKTTCLLVGFSLVFVTACSKKRDEVVMVKEDDKEIAAAIAKGRSTLPQFWKTFESPGPGEKGFALKVAITDKHGTEHFWAVDIERRDGKIMGTINNDPGIVKNVKFGQRVQIPEADISDWMYMRNGKMVGNETLKPLMKTMSAEEAAQMKSMMADPN